GIVVMSGVLSNASTSYVRDYVKRHSWVRAVIALPPETFEGYGGRADTSVLFLERKAAPDRGEQGAVFMAVCHNAGYSPHGDSIPGNELPAIPDDYRRFRRGKAVGRRPHSWSVAALADRLDADHYRLRSSEGDRSEVGARVQGVADQTA